jgi:hypothetical protein
MRRKFVEYLVLIFFIFVEFLSSYLLLARLIQNVGLRSLPQMRNARITSYSWCAGGLLEADSHVGSRKVHYTNSTLVSNTWPFFRNREKMVSSELQT